MAVTGIQSGQNVYVHSFMQDHRKKAFEPVIAGNTQSDTVQISAEGKALAQQIQTEIDRQQTTGTQTNAVIQDKDLPLEAFALPSWYSDYMPAALNHTPKINYEFFDMVGELTNDNFLSDADQSQIKNYLQNDPIHQNRLANEEFSSQFKDEITEYLGLFKGYFQEALQENGVNSNIDYYHKAVLDQSSSEKIHQSMQNRIANNPRMLALMQELGVTR